MLQDLIQKGLRLSQHALFRKFLGKAGGVLGKPAKLAMVLSNAYTKLIDTNSSESGFTQIKEIMQTFIRLVRAYANGSYRAVSNRSLLVGVGVLLYFISPIDLIPDFIPILGLMDDISLMAWFIDAFQKEITNFRAWEEGRTAEPTLGSL
ncbi:YkvA family protein [Pontibacter fetidus]|uniref:DUF1232 domain-containing protein n=1 Tax=Pontibacter fetidus TaxID=2700082 RepID=A0A6B2H2N4_9BACT|nr:DUF1232 domain-containing protein [Pontibacter fetidus]NDK56358.1 DUF1232 domain-containing protein [Pontibacter fetidus]